MTKPEEATKSKDESRESPSPQPDNQNDSMNSSALPKDSPSNNGVSLMRRITDRFNGPGLEAEELEEFWGE
jgi:hypothetical protein